MVLVIAILLVFLIGAIASRSIASAATKKTFSYVCLHSTNDNLDVIMFNKSKSSPARINVFAGTSTTPTTATAQPHRTSEFGLTPAQNNFDWMTITSDQPLVVGGNESVQNDITVGSNTTYWYSVWSITCH